MYHYTDGGLRNVWLANGYEVRKTPHGEAVAIRDLDGLTEAICKTIACKKKNLTGVEFRYLRTAGLLLSQSALAQAIGADVQSIARWEKTGRVPKMADKLIRLIWINANNGNVRLKSALETLKAVDRAQSEAASEVVIVESNGEHWEPRLTAERHELSEEDACA